ncbi:MAG: amino acid adenylation domain-containing protein [Alteromonadaceae bacterium]|jgi:amino acid adenylation domain-containing protein/non-ribosomal peptide synthase protein (TIGR01720 family)
MEYTRPRFTNIVEILEYRAENKPEQVAYYFLSNEDEPRIPLTYLTLHRRALAIANILLTHGKVGDRLLLLYPPGHEFLCAFMGCLYAGMIAVPTYPPRKNQNLDRLKNIITDADVHIILSESGLSSYESAFVIEGQQEKNTVYLLTDKINILVNETAAKAPIKTLTSSLALLQYTSGSTGNPKGVEVSHNNIMANEEAMSAAFCVSPQTISISWLPHFHDMGLFMGLLNPLFIGYPATIMSPAYFSQKPIRWLKAISKYKATLSGGPNFSYDLCVNSICDKDKEALDLSTWKIAFNGAEPISKQTIDSFYEKFKSCGLRQNSHYPCYGMAEMTLFGTGAHPKEAVTSLVLDKPSIQQGLAVVSSDKVDNYIAVSSGYCWHEHDVVIVDPISKKCCAAMEIGEIWFKGESTSKGYWNNTEQSEKIFQAYTTDTLKGPYLRTGDLGFLDGKYLYVTGRHKDVLIIRGRNYYPQDIENTISISHEALSNNNCATFSVLDSGIDKVVAVVELNRAHVRKYNAGELYKNIKGNVSKEFDLQLHDIVLLKPNRILKTSSGKIQRQANKNAYLESKFDYLEKFTDLVDDKEKLILLKESVDIIDWLKHKIANLSGLSFKQISDSDEFSSLGLDSIESVSLSEELGEYLALNIPATYIYDYPTIAKLARELSHMLHAKKALFDQKTIIQQENKVVDKQKNNDKKYTHKVAVIGLSCRFPNADNVEAFWQLIQNGESAITEAPLDRSSQLGRASYLDNITEFDAALFSISPKEARLIDPQQRLILEQSYDAILAAGYQPKQLRGSKTGVFVGISQNDYARACINNDYHHNAYFGTGNALCIAANRLSYFYDFKGPSMAIDTACSSSLVAINTAIKSLRANECDMAIVATAQLNLLPENTQSLINAQMLAKDRLCKVFDASANGYVRGEGCAVIVIKLLDQATLDKDPIRGVITGSAVCQDGRSNGLSAPNGQAQQNVIRDALVDAKLDASDIDYVEAHGTGTELGDPIELRALQQAYGQHKKMSSPLYVGAVKANIGHLEAAAGMAGFIKTLLCLEHQSIPRQIHFVKPNPHIDWQAINIKIPTAVMPWPENKGKGYAGVSSFGFGGTNAHLILEQAPTLNVLKVDEKSVSACDKDDVKSASGLLVCSSKHHDSSKNLLANYYSFIKKNKDMALADLCYTASIARPEFNYRYAIAYKNRQDLLEKLSEKSLQPCKINNPLPKIAFLFTGQGSQYAGMGKTLFDSYSVYKDSMKKCDKIVLALMGFSIIEEISIEVDSSQLNETGYSQPALFALEYSLAQLWLSWGIEANYVMGHSVGEYTAAVIAGIFSLEDGLKIVSARGKLMQELPRIGKMLSITADQMSVKALLSKYEGQVSIAAINGPNSVVISGGSTCIDNIQEHLISQRISSKLLNVSHAFHSPLMVPIIKAFTAVLSQVEFKSPKLKLVANLSSSINPESIATKEYWLDHVLAPVQFYASIQTLINEECNVFIEIGPTPHLSAMAQQYVGDDLIFIPTLRPSMDDDYLHKVALAKLVQLGFSPNWQAFYQDKNCQRVSIPTYVFNRDTFSICETFNATSDFKTNTERTKITVIENKQDTEVHKMKTSGAHTSTVSTDKISSADIISHLKSFLAICTESSVDVIDIETNLLEMGADSLIILQFARHVEAKYHLDFTISQFFNEVSTLKKLADYIQQHLPEEVNEIRSTPLSEELSNETVIQKTSSLADNCIEEQSNASVYSFHDVLQDQLKFATQIQGQHASDALTQVVAQQLAFITTKTASLSNITPSLVSLAVARGKSTDRGITVIPDNVKNKSALPPWKIVTKSTENVTPKKNAYLSALIKRYTKKTQGSKALTQSYRSVCADSRACAGFRLATKEMLYPIYGEKAQGAKTWDVDGNEYIDITMGFGVNLFGHQPPFVQQAITEQMTKSMQLGLQTPLSGKVAQLICELTGMSRVTFCNSGTEAVMTALRLARAATKRHYVVQFSGSYHGHYDGTLGESSLDNQSTVPSAPGICSGSVEDIIVLEYGSDEALVFITENAQKIAAVIVEPIQSRRPDFQPAAFLTKLRDITKARGVILIFDEMITGFRLCSGGAQQWFGIEADIATYGKIVGGGLPIGIVAGRYSHMDGIDGGQWQYGDDSYPMGETTFFAGTFCKHPLTMATSYAVLSEIKRQGAKLHGVLNKKTADLVNKLNAYFEEQQLPIRMVSCASLFRFVFSANLDVLFYQLLEKGLYVWEGRNCFLSTAHTDEDIAIIYQVIVDSTEALKHAGYLLSSKKQTSVAIDQTYKDNHIEENTPFPLTEAQQQLWAIDNIDPDAGLAYQLSSSLTLSTNIDKDYLSEAALSLLVRHPALRIICENNGQQQYYGPIPDFFTVNYTDLSLITLNKHDKLIVEHIEKQNTQGFDLSAGILFRVDLIKCQTDQYVLTIRSHHIVTDGISIGILMDELCCLYDEVANQKVANLAPAMRFDQYIQSYQNFCSSPVKQQQQNFWLGQLSDEVEATNLPTDHTPSMVSYAGKSFSIVIPNELLERLRGLSRRSGSTLFMTLFSIYRVWLHRITGQQKLVTAFPVSGRGLGLSNQEADHLVGYCTHLLPIVSEMTGQESLADFINDTKTLLLKAYENQDYPFAQLIKQLALKQDLSQRPLVSNVFNVDTITNIPMINSVNGKLINLPVNYVDFDLSLNFTHHNPSDKNEALTKSLLLAVEYRASLFSEKTITGLIDNFLTLLDQASDNTTCITSQLSWLKDKEYRLLIEDNNDTKLSIPACKSFKDLFSQQLEFNSQNIAAVDKNTRLTYQELEQKANQLAHYLLTLNIEKEQKVAIYLDKSVHQVIAVLAVMKTGAAYVPIDGSLSSERVAYMLHDSEVKLLITQVSLQKEHGKPSLITIAVDNNNDNQRILTMSKHAPNILINHDDLAYVIYTSGSTGQPKGVMVEQQHLVNRFYAWQEDFALNALKGGVHLQMAVFSFDVFMGDFIRALGSASTLVLVDKDTLLDMEALHQLIVKEQVTCAEFVPAIIQGLTSYLIDKKEVLESFKLLIVGSDSWSNQALSVVRSILPKHARLLNTYGATEATIDSSYYEVGQINPQTLNRIVPIGKPLRNVRMYILDSELKPVPQGVIGELFIGGDSVARGYHNRDALNLEKFMIDPFVDDRNARLYRTGDYARLNIDSDIEFIGRIDDQIKIRGHRVELGEIEYQVTALDQVKQCKVLVSESSNGTKKLIAYITTTVPDFIIENNKQILNGILPNYMVPDSFVCLSEFPLSANGKLDIKSLEKLEINVQSQSEYQAPCTDAEKVLTAIYIDLFTQKEIGIHDNFFELGGDSITAIQLVSRLRQLGYRCKVKDIFSQYTIAALAQSIVAAETKNHDNSLPVSGDVFANSIQKWCYEQKLEDLNYWNQAILLGCDKGIALEHIQIAFNAIVNNHDVLKMRFIETTTDHKQHYTDEEYTVPVSEFDALTLTNKADVEAFIHHSCLPLHNKMNINTGELIQVAILRMPATYQQDRLFITVNHLVIDGVSWRIILDDLQRAVENQRLEKSITSFNKTTSFQYYSQQLYSYANSDVCLQELNYWQAITQSPVATLSRLNNEIVYEDSLKTEQATLATDLTKVLLQQANQAYRTEINDLLLSALALALHQMTQAQRFRVSLEGHGRDSFQEGIDLAHTIGWFTSVYPVNLFVEDENDLGRVIQTTKQHLRNIPNGGFGYSPLRYLHQEQSIQASIDYENSIEFNYLGQFDNMDMLDTALGFNILEENMGAMRGAKNHRTNDLEIDIIVINQVLSIKVGYSDKHFENETINRFVENYIKQLTDLVIHCQETKIISHLIEDFPLAEISTEELNTVVFNECQPNDIENIYRLTSMQQGMFYHTMNEPDSQAYIDQLHCEFTNDINIEAFERAWQKVISEHSIFRTAFVFKNMAHPVQRVHQHFSTPFLFRDLSSSSDALAAFHQDNIIVRKAGFTHAEVPLMKLNLYKLDNAHYGFCWTFHHALVDGWSVANTLEAFFSHYAALAQGQELVRDVDQYQDFIGFLAAYDEVAANDFWRNYLQGFEQATHLALPMNNKETEHEQVGEEQLVTDEVLEQEIAHFCRQHQLTKNTLIQAAWALTIQLHSQEDDIVFAIACSGRPETLTDVESRIGLYINTLPLRVKFDKNQPCLTWLQDLQNNQLNILEHQYSALTTIQQQSEISAEQSLLNILLVCENYPVNDIANKSDNLLKATKICAPEHTNFAISLEALLEEQLTLKITYQPHLFSKKRVKQFLQHIKNALKQLVHSTDKTLQSLSLLTKDEKHYLVEQLNQTQVEYDKNVGVHQLIEQQVNKTPDNIAIISAEQQFTYQEFNALANGLAQQLIRSGCKKGDIVPVIAHPGIGIPVAYFAAMKSGVVFAPLDVSWPQARLHSVLNNIFDNQTSRVILTNAKADIAFNENHTNAEFISIKLDDITPQNNNLMIASQGRDALYVIHTSGTTGQPKGAINTHLGIVNRLCFMSNYFTGTAEDVILQTTYHCFDSAIWQYFWPMIMGARTVLPCWENGLDFDELLSLLDQHQVSITDFTPGVLATLYQYLLDNPEKSTSLDNVRALLIGGEALSIPVIEGVKQLQPNLRLINCYGPTETSIGVIFYDITTPIGDTLPIGRPIDNVKAYILDKNLSPVPDGAMGELYLGGDCVGLGYLNNKEATHEAFIPSPYDQGGNDLLYKTGDHVRFLASGDIAFIGRLDDQVKVRGFRVELKEIEKELERITSINNCCVCIKTDHNNEKMLLAYITINDENYQESLVKTELLNRLPHYMIPSVFQVIDEMPLTSSGKIDRKHLTKQPVLQREIRQLTVAETERQQQLFAIFSTVLATDNISIFDSFFNVGGHSLLATQLVSQIRLQLNVDIKVKHIFLAPDIASLSTLIDSLQGEGLQNTLSRFISEDKEAGTDIVNIEEIEI